MVESVASASGGTVTPPRSLRIAGHMLSLAPHGGVETSTLQDSVELAKRGHRLSIAYGQDGQLRSAYEAVGTTLGGPFRFEVAPRHPLVGARRVLPAARWIRAQTPDVVWLNRIEHLFWGISVSRWARAPLVCHLHGPPVFDRLDVLARPVRHFLAVSNFIRDGFIERGVPPEKISLIYNGIPPEHYPPGGLEERAAARDRLGLPPDVAVVLCYGQMSVAKGSLTLLDAWRQVQAADPDAYLVLVDAASADPDPAVAAALAGLDNRRIRSFPITTNVIPYLHASDVVAFPTLLPEAFGRVVIEGMATGRPVVASRIGAVSEVLHGEMSRFLVEPRSADALASKLIDVLDWRRQEPDLETRCIDWVRTHFPFTGHVDQLETALLQHAKH